MADRAAHATIKGYCYQFDYSILQILLGKDEDSFVIEGVEDIDIISSNEITAVQCKYYEGTKYKIFANLLFL